MEVEVREEASAGGPRTGDPIALLVNNTPAYPVAGKLPKLSHSSYVSKLMGVAKRGVTEKYEKGLKFITPSARVEICRFSVTSATNLYKGFDK